MEEFEWAQLIVYAYFKNEIMSLFLSMDFIYHLPSSQYSTNIYIYI